ncbi:hypothetical protein C8Q79DRAFT_315625 [Trametes meyenii]|nr:hypothetical protein C8Q79DRAFT_315625 [Trametes meyenii]
MPPANIYSLPQDTILRICRLLFYGNDPNGDGHRALAALAVTCRTLSGPALDTLWHALGSLIPLIYLLPDDLWTIEQIPLSFHGVQDTFSMAIFRTVLARDPTTDDFQRFSIYGSRVRKYGRDLTPPKYSFPTHVIPSLFWAPLMRYGPKPFLPNLESISHYEKQNGPGFEVVGNPYQPSDLLFSTMLKKVEIFIDDPYWYYERPTRLVDSLATGAWSLEDLTIDGETANPQSQHTANLCGPGISAFPSLTTFKGPAVRVSPDTLECLGRLPHLQVLLLHVDYTEYDWNNHPLGHSARLFPRLECLTLDEVQLEWCAQFILMISSRYLRDLLVVCEHGSEGATPLVLKALCGAIGGCSSSYTIQYLTIIAGHRNYPGREIYHSTHITPLLSLISLRRLTISGQCMIIVNDHALEAMSRCWPDIEELDLTWEPDTDVGIHIPHPGAMYPDARMPGDPDYPQATLAGVTHLARRCPRLRSLGAAVDMRSIPSTIDATSWELSPSPPVHLEGPEVSTLKVLGAAGSVLNSTTHVASFLSLLFPELMVVGSANNWQTWAQVPALHAQFALVRKQEREWALRHGKRLRRPI